MPPKVKFPTIIGLIILVAGTIAGIRLSSSVSSLFIKAGGDCQPINVQKTNLTYQSIDISFSTTANCLSSVQVNGKLISDSRQIGTQEYRSQTHYFQVDNLRESSTYPFEIISGGDTYSPAVFTIHTAAKPSGQVPTSDLAWGKVYTSDLKPATGAIVYVNLSDAYPLSAFVTSEGYWNISLANSLDLNQQKWFMPQDNVTEDIFVFYPGQPVTELTGNTSHNNPVPDIIIGQNTFASVSVGNQPVGGQLDNLTTPAISKSLQITSPRENEVISTLTPQFFGTAPVLSALHLVLNSATAVTVNSDNTGNWQWSPTAPLTPGHYILVVNNQITRHFSISSQTDGLAFEASASASIATPTVATPTTAISTPTIALTPTAIPTSTPTPKPRASQPSTESGVPTTASTAPTIVLFVVGTLSLIIGAMLIL